MKRYLNYRSPDAKRFTPVLSYDRHSAGQQDWKQLRKQRQEPVSPLLTPTPLIPLATLARRRLVRVINKARNESLLLSPLSCVAVSGEEETVRTSPLDTHKLWR